MGEDGHAATAAVAVAAHAPAPLPAVMCAHRFRSERGMEGKEGGGGAQGEAGSVVRQGA